MVDGYGWWRREVTASIAVTVLYLRSNPYVARINSFISLWLLPMIFGGIGAILLALGAGMIFRSRPANS